jgi:hypothetical protein
VGVQRAVRHVEIEGAGRLAIDRLKSRHPLTGTLPLLALGPLDLSLMGCRRRMRSGFVRACTPLSRTCGTLRIFLAALGRLSAPGGSVS